MNSIHCMNWRRAAGRAFVVLGLTATLRIWAQQAGPPEDAIPPEALRGPNNLAQAADSADDAAGTDDLMSTNAPSDTNAVAESGSRSNRFNRFLSSGGATNEVRRSRGRRSRRSGASQPGASNYGSGYSDRGGLDAPTTTNSPSASLDYSAFKIIVDRNIFDPNRFPRTAGGPARKPKSVDSMTLVGTMTYEKGTFAFFDGSSSEYRKALKRADSIAGYKLTGIAANYVKLASGTNELELKVGSQLRREEDGPWQLSSQAASYSEMPSSAAGSASGSTASASSPSVPSGPYSDILKKLAEQRLKQQ
jgi:hypothetical protein